MMRLLVALRHAQGDPPRWGGPPIILIVLTLALTGCRTPAPRPSPNRSDPLHYRCPRTASPPTIDGRIDEAEWSTVPWTADFVDIEGPDLPRPRFRTRVKMQWDDAALYIAAEMEEPHVWATLTKRDSVIFHDNDFEVFLDPNGDGLAYYEIEINALATEWDLLLKRPYRSGGGVVTEWNLAGMRSAAHVDGAINDPSDTDRGWSLEIAMPWTGFSEGRPAPGSSWRVNFSRVQWQTDAKDGRYVKRPVREDNWVWSPQFEINMHAPERWGYVEFVP